MYGGLWKSIISVHQHMDLSPGQSDMYFFVTRYSHILSRRRGGGGVCELFWRRRERTHQRWDEGVEFGGGQHGRSARARRSLVVASPASFKSPLGVSLEAKQNGGGSYPEERHGLATEVLMIIRRRNNPVRGFWRKYYRTHHF
jgi:hypothetical protein